MSVIKLKANHAAHILNFVKILEGEIKRYVEIASSIEDQYLNLNI